MKYKNGEESQVGDVIRWNCWDADDGCTWSYTGLVKHNGIIYLGGGIDSGGAIGELMSYDAVVCEADDNDDAGIEKIGVASDLAILINNAFKN